MSELYVYLNKAVSGGKKSKKYISLLIAILGRGNVCQFILCSEFLQNYICIIIILDIFFKMAIILTKFNSKLFLNYVLNITTQKCFMSNYKINHSSSNNGLLSVFQLFSLLFLLLTPVWNNFSNMLNMLKKSFLLLNKLFHCFPNL